MAENAPAKPVDQRPPFHPLESWRSFVAGVISIAVGCYDVWVLGPQRGLSVEIDELLILVGIGLVASMPNVLTRVFFGGAKDNGAGKEKSKAEEPEAAKEKEPDVSIPAIHG